MIHRFGASAAVLVIVTAAVGGGCRPPARSAPIPTQGPEDYCWWTVMRTTLPPDSVAARFERAFVVTGLTEATWARLADTAWAHAGPTPLGGPPATISESRVVAYRHGDTTRFRHFVTISPPQGQSADTINLAGRYIGLCGQILRAAAVRPSAPREPTGEETLAVWRRRP